MMGGESKYRCIWQIRRTVINIWMYLNISHRMVVETRSLKISIIQTKTEWFNQMKVAATICTESNDVAGIRRNLRLEKDDV